jgi:DOPA 4,5-dioxygenase
VDEVEAETMHEQLRIYRFWEKPVGPHPVAMFEVNTFNPHQTGALFSWLVVNRGPCSYVSSSIASSKAPSLTWSPTSVLIHPNTGDAYKDHTELQTWIGKPWPLHTDMLKKVFVEAHEGQWKRVEKPAANHE